MAIKREDVEALLEVHHYEPQAWHTLVHAVLEMGDALERMRVRLDPDDRPADDGEFERFARRYGELRTHQDDGYHLSHYTDEEMPVSEAEQHAREAGATHDILDHSLRAPDEERASLAKMPMGGRLMNADERARTISQADVDQAYDRNIDNFQQPEPLERPFPQPGSLDDPQQFREQPPVGDSRRAQPPASPGGRQPSRR